MQARGQRVSPMDYWESENHKDQMFYVAFCMLESALSDYAVARDLHLHQKLNWASAAYYYSLVHALRLVCFMASGDYPMAHSSLAELFENGNLKDNKGWLGKFLATAHSAYEVRSLHVMLEDIATYFGVKSGQTPYELIGKFWRWGYTLHWARKCRETSNYEGLIIAHEYAHERVTHSFNRLTECLREACPEVLKEVVLLFKSFVDSQSRSESWYSYLNWEEKREGLFYYEDTLRFKLLGKSDISKSNSSRQQLKPDSGFKESEAIITSLNEWLDPLRKVNTNN